MDKKFERKYDLETGYFLAGIPEHIYRIIKEQRTLNNYNNIVIPYYGKTKISIVECFTYENNYKHELHYALQLIRNKIVGVKIDEKYEKRLMVWDYQNKKYSVKTEHPDFRGFSPEWSVGTAIKDFDKDRDFKYFIIFKYKNE